MILSFEQFNSWMKTSYTMVLVIDWQPFQGDSDSCLMSLHLHGVWMKYSFLVAVLLPLFYESVVVKMKKVE